MNIHVYIHEYTYSDVLIYILMCIHRGVKQRQEVEGRDSPELRAQATQGICVGLFCHIVGLFCHIVGLFCYIVGVFCHTS